MFILVMIYAAIILSLCPSALCTQGNCLTCLLLVTALCPQINPVPPPHTAKVLQM